jgi:anti-sigma B factor antagonist
MRWIEITERVVDDISILDLRGQMMGMDTESRLVGAIRQLTSTGRAKILLNLVDVPYIDSNGLASIINGFKAAREVGGVVKLCGLNQRLLTVVKASRIDSFLEAFESERDAVDSFSA